MLIMKKSGILFAFLLLILFFAGSFFSGWFFRNRTNKQRNNRIIIAERDVDALIVNVDKDIESVIKDHKSTDKTKTIDKDVETKVNYTLNKVHEKIEKAKKYVLENIEEIG